MGRRLDVGKTGRVNRDGSLLWRFLQTVGGSGRGLPSSTWRHGERGSYTHSVGCDPRIPIGLSTTLAPVQPTRMVAKESYTQGTDTPPYPGHGHRPPTHPGPPWTTSLLLPDPGPPGENIHVKSRPTSLR